MLSLYLNSGGTTGDKKEVAPEHDSQELQVVEAELARLKTEKAELLETQVYQENHPILIQMGARSGIFVCISRDLSHMPHLQSPTPKHNTSQRSSNCVGRFCLPIRSIKK